MKRDRLRAHALGQALLQRGFERPLLVLAHHDDEISVAGLLQRLGPAARILWVTNSDGRYFDSDLEPAAYADLRKAEGLRSAAAAGLPAEQTACLDFSEVAIYSALGRLQADATAVEAVLPLFERMRDAVRDRVLQLRPDLVLTLAWQGGQPEHDLVHLCTRLAVDALARESGRPPLLLHFPAYEYTYAWAARFNPLYRGRRMRIQLTPAERRLKWAMVQAYPSQVSLFRYFRWAFRFVLRPAALLTGGPRSLEDFFAEEEFGPVPADIDYTARPHRFDWLNYMFDDYEGTPITFDGSIRPLVRVLRPAAGDRR
jgi:LmbE family N-acetylglucosaminyl deacetylase